MHEHREDLRPHGKSAAAIVPVGLTAVDAVLGGVQITVGKLGHVIVEVAVHHVEAIALIGFRHNLVYLAQAGKRELVVAGQLFGRHGIGRGVEAALDLAEQEAKRVADLAIRLTDVGEDLAIARDVIGGIDRGDPQAHDIGTAGVAFLVRVDDVAERLGHLAALAVKREALGDNRLVGSRAVRAHRSHERAHEPAAVLVGAFEVHIGRELEVVAVLADGGVGNA